VWNYDDLATVEIIVPMLKSMGLKKDSALTEIAWMHTVSYCSMIIAESNNNILIRDIHTMATSYYDGYTNALMWLIQFHKLNNGNGIEKMLDEWATLYTAGNHDSKEKALLEKIKKRSP
jgi:hypothetical protein